MRTSLFLLRSFTARNAAHFIKNRALQQVPARACSRSLHGTLPVMLCSVSAFRVVFAFDSASVSARLSYLMRLPIICSLLRYSRHCFALIAALLSRPVARLRQGGQPPQFSLSPPPPIGLVYPLEFLFAFIYSEK